MGDCKPTYCETTPSRTTSIITTPSPVTPCVLTMENFPVETIVKAQPSGSSQEDIAVLTHDLKDKYIGGVKLSEVPQGSAVFLLSPSVEFPTTKITGNGKPVALVLSSEHTKLPVFNEVSKYFSPMTSFTTYPFAVENGPSYIVVVFKTEEGKPYDIPFDGSIYAFTEFNSEDELPEIAGPVMLMMPKGAKATVRECRETTTVTPTTTYTTYTTPTPYTPTATGPTVCPYGYRWVLKDGVKANNYQPDKPLAVEIKETGDVDEEILEVLTKGDKTPDILIPERIHSTYSPALNTYLSELLPTQLGKQAYGIVFATKKSEKDIKYMFTTRH